MERGFEDVVSWMRRAGWSEDRLVGALVALALVCAPAVASAGLYKFAQPDGSILVTTEWRADLELIEIIEGALKELGADLMVMGGYGHSRLREAIFSGVSRSVLEAPSVPVLVSH